MRGVAILNVKWDEKQFSKSSEVSTSSLGLFLPSFITCRASCNRWGPRSTSIEFNHCCPILKFTPNFPFSSERSLSLYSSPAILSSHRPWQNVSKQFYLSTCLKKEEKLLPPRCPPPDWRVPVCRAAARKNRFWTGHRTPLSTLDQHEELRCRPFQLLQNNFPHFPIIASLFIFHNKR